ncbi:MAG: hypothetical protein AAGG01_14990 [Planctomycetota bacterium]
MHTLVRGERIHRAGSPHVLMRDDIFDRRGIPDPVYAKEVARGVLWLRPLMATQTTHVLPPTEKEDRRAWSTGSGSIQDAATSWDAWRRGRPNVNVSTWNEPAPGMPRAGLKPLLPRRIRLELELQRTSDRQRAPELVDILDETTTAFEVSNGQRAKALIGRHAMVGGEWMKITGVSGDRVTVQRATRLTAARSHPSGTKLLVGAPAVIDLPIVMYEDDWRLGASSVDEAAAGGGR